MATARSAVWPGKPYPLGASWDGSGVNFALFSTHATKVELCLFDRSGRRELERIELLDPYARVLQGGLSWTDAHFGYRLGSPRQDLSFDRRHNARAMPKCRVIDPAFTWGDDRRPRVPWPQTLIYETHVRGMTMRHPDVPSPLPGSYPGLGPPSAA